MKKEPCKACGGCGNFLCIYEVRAKAYWSSNYDTITRSHVSTCGVCGGTGSTDWISNMMYSEYKCSEANTVSNYQSGIIKNLTIYPITQYEMKKIGHNWGKVFSHMFNDNGGVVKMYYKRGDKGIEKIS